MQNRKERKRNDKRIIESAVGIVFAGCIIFFIVLNLLVPDKELSQEENRMLAGKPKLTVNSLLSGEFMKKFETYQADQFAGRSIWRDVKIAMSRVGGSREENGVLLGKNGQLLEEIVTPNQDNLTANLDAIEAFSQKYSDIPMNMLLVPDAANVLENKLPVFASVADQERMMSQVKRELSDYVGWIDASAALYKHQDEKIYYKTDHHWTSLGAFYVFDAATEKLGIDADASSTFAAYPVTTKFNGALASKSGFNLNEEEKIDIYIAKETDNDLVVNYVDEQKKTASLYDSEKLASRDKYGVFLGGNTSVIDIKTVSESSRRLMIAKDSFANSFIPFLTPYFREIIVVDPRYYSGTMDDIMDTYRISDVLFLYSGNTFFSDNNISGVLGE